MLRGRLQGKRGDRNVNRVRNADGPVHRLEQRWSFFAAPRFRSTQTRRKKRSEGCAAARKRSMPNPTRAARFDFIYKWCRKLNSAPPVRRCKISPLPRESIPTSRERPQTAAPHVGRHISYDDQMLQYSNCSSSIAQELHNYFCDPNHAPARTLAHGVNERGDYGTQRQGKGCNLALVSVRGDHYYDGNNASPRAAAPLTRSPR